MNEDEFPPGESKNRLTLPSLVRICIIGGGLWILIWIFFKVAGCYAP